MREYLFREVEIVENEEKKKIEDSHYTVFLMPS